MRALKLLESPDVGWKLFFAFSYLALVGLLIAANGFLPFITDNNETFSSLAHASNIYNFGFRGTFGLTDETISPDPAAGPYVYTHMGNFPRFFALLIYIFGARSPEAQIVLTAATVGLAGYLLAFHFFSRRVGVAFAAIYCLLFITDYLMALQWQVVTWQVWRFLFLFVSLILVDRLRERPSIPLAAIAIVSFACLNYYDIPFSVFVGTAAVIYGITVRQSWRSRFLIVGTVGVGFFIGAAVLITQSILALGWDVFLQDLRNTYLARNVLSPGSAALKSVKEFYETNNIVFWPNFFDASSFREPTQFIGALFKYVFSVYTPLTTSLALIVAGMTALGTVGGSTKSTSEQQDFSVVQAFFVAAVAWCGMTTLFVVSASIRDIWLRGLLVSIAVAALAYDLCINVLVSAMREGRLPDRRLWLATLWLFVLGLIFLVSPGIYEPELVPLFQEIQWFVGGPVVANLWLILALWVGIRILAVGIEAHASAIRTLVRLLVAGFIAYVVVIVLVPGYVITTIMYRLAPLTIGFHLIVFALTLFGGGYSLLTLWSGVSKSRREQVEIAGFAVTLAVFTIAWTATQVTYAVRLPGDTFQLFKALQAPQFRGTSFVADTYAAPFGVVSKSWAHIDLAIWHDRIKVGVDGYEVEHDKDYLWFKDRDTNPAYLQPQYYVCFIQRNRSYAVPNASYSGCGYRGLVNKARSGGNALLAPQEVLRDPSPEDRWSVIKLNWNFPAYLRPREDRSRYIDLTGRRDGDLLRLDAVFDAVQRDDRVSGINYRLYRLDSCAAVVRTLIGSSDKNDLSVEADGRGVYQVGIELLPTKSQVAVEFFSFPQMLAGQQLRECGRASPGQLFIFRKISNPMH